VRSRRRLVGAPEGHIRAGWGARVGHLPLVCPRFSSPCRVAVVAVCALAPRWRLAERYVNPQVVRVLMPGVALVEHAGAVWPSTRSAPVPITADLAVAPDQPNPWSLNQRWKVRMLASWAHTRVLQPALSCTNGHWRRTGNSTAYEPSRPSRLHRQCRANAARHAVLPPASARLFERAGQGSDDK
jgi:hypothetical protein